MSNSDNAVSADASLDELHGVGSARSDYLPRDSVGELANSSAQQIANEMDDEMSPGEIEEVVETARESLDDYDGRVTAKVYTKSEDDEDEESEDTEVVSESFGDDADAFIDAGGSTLDKLSPSECETVAIIAGDDAFSPNGKHGDMSPEEMAKLVQQRLVEFGFAGADTIVALGSGMGRTAVNAWVKYTRNETDRELPELKQVSVNVENGYPSGDDYRERNQRLLEEADGVCTVANGDYIGMWVNMVNEEPDDEIIIRTPELDDDE